MYMVINFPAFFTVFMFSSCCHKTRLYYYGNIDLCLSVDLLGAVAERDDDVDRTRQIDLLFSLFFNTFLATVIRYYFLF